ncbi:MAG TPA: uroporphyrinogen-III synthase [Bryobacteraceae bacterium]|nr:uroporphyrinogen-III synthase [Bryobacteraceae bacterium]
MPFDSLRVLSLESRRRNEMATLIAKQGGEPFVAESMREVAFEEQSDVFEFGERLLRGEFDCVILLTGVGTRMLWKALVSRFDEQKLKTALAKTTTAVRGPKPSAALREIGLTPTVLAPEPNTWRELLDALRPRQERRIAVQEYGQPNQRLLEGLREQGREVTRIPVYGWDLPQDTSQLRDAVARLAAGRIDVVLLTTSMQVVNLMRIAAEEGIDQQVREALESGCVGSIGPTTTETLEEYGLKPDYEPTHPKMGLLVNEIAERAAGILARKRS